MPIPTGSFLQKFLSDPTKTEMLGTGLGFREAIARKRADETLDPFGQNAMDRLATIGSLGKNAQDLTKMNGDRRFDTGELSQGAQELAQKVEQNEKTGVLQRVAGFLNKMNPFDNLFPDNRVDYLNPDGTTQKVNPDFLKLIMNRPDLKERFDRTGSIYSDM